MCMKNVAHCHIGTKPMVDVTHDKASYAAVTHDKASYAAMVNIKYTFTHTKVAKV